MTDPLHIVCPACDAVNRVPRAKLGDGAKCGKCAEPLFRYAPLPLDTARFERHVSRSDLPLLVDFWAPWCGPCQMMAPAFEEAARQLEPEVRLIKVNTEEAPQLAARFGIRSIPTLMLMQSGREKARISGAMDPKSLITWTRQYL